MAPHPFASRWNHNAHYYPLLAAAVGESARTVVDVGCGDGTLARFLARPGRDVLGVDPDPRGVLEAQAGVRVVAARAEELPCADATVDALVMVMALHHTDAPAALAEMRRVVRPGGTVAILGYGRSAGFRDRVLEARDVAAHRHHSRAMTAWEPDVALADPSLTWAQTRDQLRLELPGSTWRRLPMWRYLATWQAA
ncbi:MAG: class I SAM-dependent methyltransferase [Actinobacteria bacterium]|nr:class I SAM-dependent methyltransferase [Actinomycetota bacterium]MCG2800822.1 class I SAM-dependent methyltransferase [Cellulomonas sp.]